MRQSAGAVIYTLATATVFAALAPVTAFAYTGPGAGITAIGSLLALIAALLLALVGFVWYPLKRLLGVKSTKKKADVQQPESAASQ